MRKTILLLAMVAVLFSCNSKYAPEAQHPVTFRVPALQVDTEPMNAPRKVAPLTDEDGQQMTDLFLFDGATQVLRQQSTDHDFGTVTVLLAEG